MIILGIDPGSRTTGFGVIRMFGSKMEYLSCGCIRTTGQSIPTRLDEIFNGVGEVVEKYQPDCMAIEQVFVAKNPGSALKLGQARGAAIVACVSRELEVSEYSARQVKQSVVGYGNAEKIQVQQMVAKLLGLNKTPQSDAADALAIAICHAQSSKSVQQLAFASNNKRGYTR